MYHKLVASWPTNCFLDLFKDILVMLGSMSRSGEGQVQVRWWSGRSESGQSHVNLKTLTLAIQYFWFSPPPTQTFFLAFKGSREDGPGWLG